MTRYHLITISLILAIISVACNLSSPTSTSLEITQSVQDVTPLATTQLENLPTETTIVEPTAIPTSTPLQSDTSQVEQVASVSTVNLPLFNPSEPPAEGNCVVRPSQAGTLINMRQGAGLGYQVLAQLQTYATILDVVGEWYSVRADNQILYVSSTVTTLHGTCDFLSSNDASSSQQCTPDPLRFPDETMVRIIPSSVSIFDHPGQPQVTGLIPKDEVVYTMGNPVCGNSSWFQQVHYTSDEDILTAWILMYSNDGAQNYTSQINNSSGNYTD